MANANTNNQIINSQKPMREFLEQFSSYAEEVLDVAEKINNSFGNIRLSQEANVYDYLISNTQEKILNELSSMGYVQKNDEWYEKVENKNIDFDVVKTYAIQSKVSTIISIVLEFSSKANSIITLREYAKSDTYQPKEKMLTFWECKNLIQNTDMLSNEKEWFHIFFIMKECGFLDKKRCYYGKNVGQYNDFYAPSKTLTAKNLKEDLAPVLMEILSPVVQKKIDDWKFLAGIKD